MTLIASLIKFHIEHINLLILFYTFGGYGVIQIYKQHGLLLTLFLTSLALLSATLAWMAVYNDYFRSRGDPETLVDPVVDPRPPPTAPTTMSDFAVKARQFAESRLITELKVPSNDITFIGGDEVLGVFFVCNKSDVTIARWFVYSLDENINNRWYIKETYADNSHSGPLTDSFHLNPSTFQGQNQWIIPFDSNLMFRLVINRNNILAKIDVIDSHVPDQAFKQNSYFTTLRSFVSHDRSFDKATACVRSGL